MIRSKFVYRVVEEVTVRDHDGEVHVVARDEGCVQQSDAVLQGGFMSVRSLLIVAVLILIGLFAALNWSAFTAPTRLSLIFGSVEAPLGLLMLFVIALLTVLFLVFIVYLQTSVLLESRRYAKELQAQRELADRAEASRFTELRQFVETELAALRVAHQSSIESVSSRIDLAERALRDEVEQAANSLSAYIGEVDDKLDRALGGRSG